MFLKFGDKTKKASVSIPKEKSDKLIVNGEDIDDKDSLPGGIKRAIDFFTQKNKSTNNKK